MEKEIVLQKITERCDVAWKLTEEERQKKIRKAASLGEQIQALLKQQAALCLEIDSGYEKRWTVCERRLVKRPLGLAYTMGDEKPKERYFVQVIHPQTGEVLKESLATDADLQQPLFQDSICGTPGQDDGAF